MGYTGITDKYIIFDIGIWSRTYTVTAGSNGDIMRI